MEAAVERLYHTRDRFFDTHGTEDALKKDEAVKVELARVLDLFSPMQGL